MLSRMLRLPFQKNSVFLFGPRQVGKSTLVKHLLATEDHLEIDLLKGEILLKYKANPSLLRAETDFLAQKKNTVYVFIDEIQKCPELLNEVHFLIEQYGRHVIFILTGSSARKLKSVSVNMLAGRAWQFFLFPFTHTELGEKFSLDDALFRGTLPPIKSSPTVKPGALRGLKSFMEDHPGAKPVCVSTCDTPYMTGGIQVIPWNTLFSNDYLDLL